MGLPTRLAPTRPRPLTPIRPPPVPGQPPPAPASGLGAALGSGVAPVAPSATPPPPAASAPPQAAVPRAAQTGLGAPLPESDPLYADREDDVSVLVNEMAQQDSLLMQQAATSGLQTANDRGMVNSSMSAGAAQAATLDYITPIASQNATQQFNMNMSGLQTQQDLVLAEFDRDTQQTLQKTQIRADSREAELNREFQADTLASEQSFSASQTASDQAFQTGLLASEQTFTASQTASQQAFQSEMVAAEQAFAATQTSAQQAFEAEQLAAQQAFQSGEAQSGRDFVQEQMDFEAQQAQDVRDFQATQADLDRQMQAALANMELSGADQTAATAMLTDAFSDYNQMHAQILANPDLSAEERISQINTNQEMLEDRISFTEDLYGASFNWPASPWTTGGAGSSPTQ